MHHIDFYYDCISPYAYLAFERLPEALLGLSYSVQYRPILFAGLLKHHGQLGPAEIAPKRDWTYRQVAWQAHQLGIPLQMPAAHPFNPLALQRLAVACGRDGATNRYVTETLLRHVWQGGGAAGDDAARLQALAQQLAPSRDPASDGVKAELKANTEAAIALGLFGVPTLLLQSEDAPPRAFWGLDALPMLRACMEGDAWFAGGAWEQAPQIPQGVRRVAGGPPPAAR